MTISKTTLGRMNARERRALCSGISGELQAAARKTIYEISQAESVTDAVDARKRGVSDLSELLDDLCNARAIELGAEE